MDKLFVRKQNYSIPIAFCVNLRVNFNNSGLILKPLNLK